MKDIKRLVGDRIRELRKEKGFSQDALGLKAGLHYTYIGAIERGEKNWSIDTLAKIVKGLDTDIRDLFTFSAQVEHTGQLRAETTKEINRLSPSTLKHLLDLLKEIKQGEIEQSFKKSRKRKI